ncbi:MAG: hypothetical protein IT285_07280 [Bdellovibrionales bacterium]|nr:hypothetical protein [Bdellovibrionales bacterium]
MSKSGCGAFLIFCAGIIAWGEAPAAFASGLIAQEPGSDEDHRIEVVPSSARGLSGLSMELERVEASEGSFRVLISGEVSVPKWAIVVELGEGNRAARSESILVGEDKRFEVELDYSGPQSERIPGRVVATDPSGKLFRDNFFILRSQPQPPRIGFTPSLGLGAVRYTQAGKVSINLAALNFKLSFDRRVFSRWIAGANAFVTAVTFSERPESVRFFGMNVRGGYEFPGAPGAWRFRLLAGMYYTTMWVSPERFGYAQVMGPQLYPAVVRELSGSRSITAYLKYSPISVGVLKFSFDGAEFATGLSYSFARWKERWPIAVFADFASFRMDLGASSIRSTSFGLGCGVGF